MDDGMIDGVEAMTTFLNLVASEPEIARVPIMIDSSRWEVIEAGLSVVQGRAIVNSISLKEGEESLLERARKIRRYGAAVVVMLFDEQGQADSYERKVEVAERAYRLLINDGFPPEAIIFDPNILAVATGIPEHDGYAKAFIDATRTIRERCPHAKISGGVSNLSFAFRGNNTVREAMHSAFLYHAIEAGMDMGIVNPQLLQIYSTIEPNLLERVEDVLLCRRSDATERLSALAEELKNRGKEQQEEQGESWRNESLKERIRHAMLKGVSEYIEADALEAYHEMGSAMAVIDGLLMPAMEEVGGLFGAGKMFLPQVVKSARVMKGAVAALTPWIEADTELGSAGKVLLATVKGDVHDIGKNIVSVVMACGGYRIHDLGVMVEAEKIVEEALRLEVDAIGLSGLITPSLEEMIHVCKELERRGSTIPVLVGGATTSALHTALKMAPHYSGPVIHAANASENVKIMASLMGAEREKWIEEHQKGQEELRRAFIRGEQERRLEPIVEVRRERREKPQSEVIAPLHTGRVVFSEVEIEAVEPLIDWNFFFHAWGLKGHYPDLFGHPVRGEEARKLFADAEAILQRIKQEKRLRLQGVVGIFPAKRIKETILLSDPKGKEYKLPMLRNQTRGEEHLSLVDFVATKGDWMGCFALSAGIDLQPFAEELRQAGDDYSALLAKLLADRLTEAFAEYVHRFVRREMWGYAAEESLSPQQIIRGEYRGLRMAFGYPATPDHALKRPIFDLLRVEQFTAMRLTENFMIDPGEALCGLILSDARYFSVGAIDQKQLLDYARAWGVEPEEIRRRLPNNTLS
jgi:5-methyltetrahydrofolate--homocysteine methyltransferase